ncbi:MAG: hypothetical protein QOD10_4706 [Mycobacterium sp.]|jgi:hypothetical protein|nr:hypothetical protein [Mycobacterium sp.]
MLISQPLKPVVGTAIAAAALGLAAVLGAGTAHAGAADDQFLAALHQQGISFGNPQSAINAAHHVCDALGQGMEPSQISQQLASHNPQIDRQTALLITVDSAQSYCPQYVHRMANGATVVGPNH